MENTIIKNRILVNMLDMQHHKMIFSNKLIDLEHETIEYYKIKLEKALFNNQIKEIIVGKEHYLFNLARNMVIDDEQFIDGARQITQDWFNLAVNIEDMPDSNILFIECNKDGVKHLVIIKLNYKISQVAKVEQEAIKLINVQSLPAKGSNIEEAIIIDLENDKLFIIEKKFMIDGKLDFYLNNQYIKGETTLTNRQKINLVTKVIKKVDSEYNLFPCDPTPIIKKELKDLAMANLPIKPLEVTSTLMAKDYNAMEAANQIFTDLGIDQAIIDSSNLPGINKMDRCRLILDDDRIIELGIDDYLEKINLIEENQEDGKLKIILNNIDEIKIR